MPTWTTHRGPPVLKPIRALVVLGAMPLVEVGRKGGPVGCGDIQPHLSSPPPPSLPLQSPPKGATIPYHPGLSLGTILLSANQVRGHSPPRGTGWPGGPASAGEGQLW